MALIAALAEQTGAPQLFWQDQGGSLLALTEKDLQELIQSDVFRDLLSPHTEQGINYRSVDQMVTGFYYLQNVPQDFRLFPPEFQGSAHIEDINLSGCHLRFMPPLGAFISLTRLHIDNNELVVTPDVSSLENLTDFDLGNNRLKTPPDLSKNTRLRSLRLSDNPFTADPYVSHLVHLAFLNLSNTNLKNAPNVRGLRKLVWLDLSYNSLDSVGDLTALTKLLDLYLQGNGLNSMPYIRDLVNLTTFALDKPAYENTLLSNTLILPPPSRDGNQYLILQIGPQNAYNAFEYTVRFLKKKTGPVNLNIARMN